MLPLWVPLAAILGALGVVLRQLGSQVACVPVWFLAAYLVVVAAAPLTFALHRRFGFGAVAGLIAVAAIIDVAHGSGVPALGWANFVFVWGAIH